MNRTIEYVVIGSPTDKRPRLYAQELFLLSDSELKQHGVDHVKLTRYTWQELLSLRGISRHDERYDHTVVRLFSPWTEDGLYDLIISEGMQELESQGKLLKVMEMHPRDPIVYNSIVAVEGMKRILINAEGAIRSTYPSAHLLTPVGYAISATDKRIESNNLLNMGIPHPVTITDPVSPEQILEYLCGNTRTDTLYVKPRGGSGGDLISVLRRGSAGYELKTPLVRTARGYSLGDGMGCVTDISTIHEVLNLMIDVGVVVQEGIDKVSVEGRNVDVRMHVINMEVPYHYFRMGEAEISNISCGGKGCFDPQKGFGGIPEHVIDRGKELSVRIAEHFHAFDFGSDVMFTPDFKNVYILETNAFPSCFEDSYAVFPFYRHEILSTLRRLQG